MPRIVRRQTTYQRLTSLLNPFDFILQLATDYEAFDWDSVQATWGTPIGILLNVFCLVARGQAEKFRKAGSDDVFRRSSSSHSGIANGIAYFLGAISWGLAIFSIVNAVYCFGRKKRYRMFEQNIEVEPQTPNARRVPVDSSPTASSPMRILSSITEVLRNDAASRAHPDETRDVWEISVWDPSPLSLHLFALFSPVHVAIYFLSLPLASPVSSSLHETNSSPAAIYFTVILTQFLLSLQILFMKSAFTIQSRDQKVINSQVMQEYNQKYVHPRLNVIKRDVAVQCDGVVGSLGSIQDQVLVYTPQFNRTGFKTHPNPHYEDLTLPHGTPTAGSRGLQTRRLSTWADVSANDQVPLQKIRQPVFDRITNGASSSGRRSLGTSTSTGTSTYGAGVDENGFSRRNRLQELENGYDSMSATSSRYGSIEPSSSRYGSVEPSASSRIGQSSLEPTRRLVREEIVDPRSPRASEGSYDPTVGRRLLGHEGAFQPPQRLGTEGLVDWSRQNSRGLSPSKGTPLKRGSTVRGSSYAESLGAPLGTPRRGRQF
ncbi:hypothetical protein BZA77DRAFT_311218 [Pyronema omphalodes]|nr:hypothetical protein BZA77DRAFT_311218 [Pyronema omphalodes]